MVTCCRRVHGLALPVAAAYGLEKRAGCVWARPAESLPNLCRMRVESLPNPYRIPALCLAGGIVWSVLPGLGLRCVGLCSLGFVRAGAAGLWPERFGGCVAGLGLAGGLGDCGVFGRKSGGFWVGCGWVLGVDFGLGRSLLRGKIEARANGICAGWERVSGRQRLGGKRSRRDGSAGSGLAQVAPVGLNGLSDLDGRSGPDGPVRMVCLEWHAAMDGRAGFV